MNSKDLGTVFFIVVVEQSHRYTQIVIETEKYKPDEGCNQLKQSTAKNVTFGMIFPKSALKYTQTNAVYK